MKANFSLFLFTLIFLTSKVQAQENFAVVELFTSESCSSCPVADEFLIELTNLAKEQDQPVYTLGFHVDYWNYLGWVDEYSKAEYSQRQRDYARKIAGSSVYTPQMIVNGKYQFGGYRRDLAQTYIDRSLAESQNLPIKASIESFDNKCVVTVSLPKTDGSLSINTALVEARSGNKINSGENAGRSLRHANVVREFITTAADKKQQTITLKFPSDLNRQNSSVIVYLQEKDSYNIVGAVQLHLRT